MDQKDMGDIPLSEYLQSVEQSWKTQDGDGVAKLLSLSLAAVGDYNLDVQQLENLVEKFMRAPLLEIVRSHLDCVGALVKKNPWDAYQHQDNMIKSLLKVMGLLKDENWCLPIMYAACTDLRLIAQTAAKQKSRPGKFLERAGECLMECYRMCAPGESSSLGSTKKVGMLPIVNELFRIYFRINRLHLCKPLIRAVEMASFKETFPISQQVTYRYFVGRKAMYDSRYRAADEYLTFAFENCHKASRKNKRLILISLIPVKMLLGCIPKKQVVEKYDLMEFWELIEAVCQGNMKYLEQVIEKYETFFTRFNVNWMFEKLRALTYRNLFRKVYSILNSYQIPLEALQTALRHSRGADVDLEETKRIALNLVRDGMMKGYVSPGTQNLIVAKQNPFALSSLL